MASQQVQGSSCSFLPGPGINRWLRLWPASFPRLCGQGSKSGLHACTAGASPPEPPLWGLRTRILQELLAVCLHTLSRASWCPQGNKLPVTACFPESSDESSSSAVLPLRAAMGPSHKSLVVLTSQDPVSKCKASMTLGNPYSLIGRRKHGFSHWNLKRNSTYKFRRRQCAEENRWCRPSWGMQVKGLVSQATWWSGNIVLGLWKPQPSYNKWRQLEI